ncbi:MAG: SLOG family protein [Synechococcus sp.]
MLIIAAGGRALRWPPPRIAAHLLRLSQGRLVRCLFHGAAPGADRAIGLAAHQLGWPVRPFPAQWHRHGRAAGPLRNRRMLEHACAELAALPNGAGLLVVAFPGGRGTASLVQLTRGLQGRSSLPIALAQITA